MNEFEDNPQITGADNLLAPAPVHESLVNATLTEEQRSHVAEHIHWVEPTAKRMIFDWRKKLHVLEDAIGDGYVGLIKGAIDYDPSKAREAATTDSNYFISKIMGEILHGLRATRGRSEIGGVANVKPSVLHGTVRSLSEPVGRDRASKMALLDTVAAPSSDKIFDMSSLRLDLQTVLKSLPPRDQEIFLRLVVYGETQTDVAEAVGVSQMHVSRINKRTLKRLQARLADYHES